MSLRNAVSLYAHQKQTANKFFQKVSMILTASDCTCEHYLNTITLLLLPYIKHHWEEYSMTEYLL